MEISKGEARRGELDLEVEGGSFVGDDKGQGLGGGIKVEPRAQNGMGIEEIEKAILEDKEVRGFTEEETQHSYAGAAWNSSAPAHLR